MVYNYQDFIAGGNQCGTQRASFMHSTDCSNVVLLVLLPSTLDGNFSAPRCCFQRQYRLSPWSTFAKVYIVCICNACRSRSILTFFMFIHVIQPWNRYLGTFPLLPLSTFSSYIGNFLSKLSYTDSYWDGKMIPYIFYNEVLWSLCLLICLPLLQQ